MPFEKQGHYHLFKGYLIERYNILTTLAKSDTIHWLAHNPSSHDFNVFHSDQYR